MAHPPKLRSDLTLQMFLHETILGESLIKLDFKTLLSVGLSLQIINEVADNVSWIYLHQVLILLAVANMNSSLPK